MGQTASSELGDRVELSKAVSEDSRDWGDVLILSPSRIPELTAVHIEIVEIVRESGIGSVNELADCFDRETGEIRSAVAQLVEMHILDQENGLLTVPHETVLIAVLTPDKDSADCQSREV